MRKFICLILLGGSLFGAVNVTVQSGPNDYYWNGPGYYNGYYFYGEPAYYSWYQRNGVGGWWGINHGWGWGWGNRHGYNHGWGAHHGWGHGGHHHGGHRRASWRRPSPIDIKKPLQIEGVHN